MRVDRHALLDLLVSNAPNNDSLIGSTQEPIIVDMIGAIRETGMVNPNLSRVITYLTHQAEKLRGEGRHFCVRTASGSDRISRNLRNPMRLPDPVATARGSDTMPIF